MSTRRRPTIALVALIVANLALAAPAQAQSTPQTPPELVPPGLRGTTCPDQSNEHEAADRQVIDDIIAAVQRERFAALRRRIDALRAVASHAPSCYPEIEDRGDQVVLRIADAPPALTLGILAGAAIQQKRMSVAQEPNIYGDAFLLLGSHYVEAREPEEAIAWLDRGLAIQSANQLLISEKVAALNLLRRYADAAALLQSALDNPALELTLDRSRFLRLLGVTLIDLNRLDEAETALNESIRLNPDNPIARNELRYIAQLRAGRRPTQMTITAPDAQPQPQDPEKKK
jgi:tetratricopeptide (TPR) repeat protein